MASITLLADNTAQFNRLADSLQDAGYSVTHIPPDGEIAISSGEAMLAYITSKPDVISNLSKTTEDDIPPLRVLLVDAELTIGSEIPSSVDLVLPINTSFSTSQLLSILALQQQRILDKKRNDEQFIEIKQLRDKLSRQERINSEMEILKTALVRNVSHELKTPLLQVKSAVSLMSEDSDNNELVTYAQNATGRLEAIIKNITLLGSSLDVNIGPVVVRDTFEYARRNLARSWDHRNEIGRVVFNTDNDLPPVLADKQGLSTVIQLLVDNALKFSKDDVTVSAVTSGNAVTITISDTGIGIDQDNIDVIFDSFFQVDRSSTRRYGGMGVGLAIVRLILDHHDAEIEVKSIIGKGSSFSFSLPQVKL